MSNFNSSTTNFTNSTAWNDTVVHRTYHPPGLVTTLVTRTPRFGHTHDIASLFQKADQRNYLSGLVFGGAFLIAAYLVWALFLLVCLCIKKAGFLSGAPLQEPATKTAVNQSRPMRVRMVFLLAAIIYTLFSILFVTQGVANLDHSANVFHNTFVDLQGMGNNVRNLLENNLTEAAASAKNISAGLTAELQPNAFCPQMPSMYIVRFKLYITYVSIINTSHSLFVNSY
jgi:hypothetical protein